MTLYLASILVTLLLILPNSKWVAAGKFSRVSSSKTNTGKRIALKRILSEWKEVVNAGLSLDVPFNSTIEEVMISLYNFSLILLTDHFIIVWNPTLAIEK